MADPAVVGGGIGATIMTLLGVLVRHWEIKTRFSNGSGDAICRKLDKIIESQETTEKARQLRAEQTLTEFRAIATSLNGLPERIANLMKSTDR